MDPAKAFHMVISAQAKQATKPITANQGKFNNLSTTVVPKVSALISQGSSSDSRNTVQSRKRLLSDVSDTDSVPRKRAKIEPSNNEQLHSDTSIAATGSPALVFRNMKKLDIQNPELIPGCLVKYFRCADGTLGQDRFSVSNNYLKELTGVFVFDFDKGENYQCSTSTFRALYNLYSIYAGKLDDGMLFLRMLSPGYCERLFKLDYYHQKIQYPGYQDLQAMAEVYPFSLYCGKTYEETLAAFELACKGTDLATFIRPLLGFGSVSFSTILEAQKTEVPGLQPGVPEPVPMDCTTADLFTGDYAF